jgi:hypothetical protein
LEVDLGSLSAKLVVMAVIVVPFGTPDPVTASPIVGCGDIEARVEVDTIISLRPIVVAFTYL